VSEARVFLVSWVKLPQSTTQIFYVEREDDEDTLRQRLEDRGFRGMSFIPVWSSSEGPASVNLHEVV
jgi:hypothetical protein